MEDPEVAVDEELRPEEGEHAEGKVVGDETLLHGEEALTETVAAVDGGLRERIVVQHLKSGGAALGQHLLLHRWAVGRDLDLDLDLDHDLDLDLDQ